MDAAVAKTPSREASGLPVGRTAPRGIRVARARQASPATGTSSAIAPFSIIPQPTATIPSESTRASISASPGAPGGVAESRRRVVVEGREPARGEPGEEVGDRRDHPAKSVDRGLLGNVRLAAGEEARKGVRGELGEEEKRTHNDRDRNGEACDPGERRLLPAATRAL